MKINEQWEALKEESHVKMCIRDRDKVTLIKGANNHADRNIK